MNLSPETIAQKRRELEEALVKRDNSARAVESLKEDLKTERGYLVSLEALIRELAMEVATGKGSGDQLPLPSVAAPASKPSAAERTIPLSLEGNATPPPESPSTKAPEDPATRNQLSNFVRSFSGQKVTMAQIIDAFPGHEAEAIRGHLVALVDREEIFALLDGWRGRTSEAPASLPGAPPSDEQIEAEEEARAAHNLRESWRTMALAIVENHGTTGISGPDLHEIVCAVCADQALAAPSSEELLDLLVTMIKSGALTRDAQGWYVCPPAPPSDANVQRAALRVLQVEKGWCTQASLVRLTQEEFPIGVCPPESQILDCLRALQRGGRVEWDGDDGVPCWKGIPEAPKVKPSKKAPSKKASLAEASQAAYEAEGEALGKALEEEDFDTTLFRPSKHPEHLLPTLTSKGKGRVLALLREAPGGRLPVEEIRRRLRLPIVPLPSECSYQSGDWVLEERAPKKAPARRPARGRKGR